VAVMDVCLCFPRLREHSPSQHADFQKGWGEESESGSS